MSHPDLPSDWTAGRYEKNRESYYDPPSSSNPSRILLWGMMEGDAGHRLYDIPMDASVEEIVQVFQVGAHNAYIRGVNEQESVDMTASVAKKIEKLIPFRVIFADQAGLKLKFERQITEPELQNLEGWLTKDDPFQAGLEIYISEWDGESPLLAPVLEENLLHLWWD
ncbi:hypothetical protein SAMN02745216_04094 [Desulfatibacillum alkenivorans DSM 16219]|jgi:hypothetical protein|uniref:DUF4253 domain-containing protein n=1 Tax=Desulfatibacillum alkenivorans DSM 16219 TaxID=1121393 RepID=A0A1M6VET5_9BACT|nr:hypothetical protein [Desulfatibacillum alkenivorans]SHK80057.1 hypothetical protein SAMN02745216_04094 [Desulfatibacillum alkenivorans DSM 16219]